jgi:hypothetical protein
LILIDNLDILAKIFYYDNGKERLKHISEIEQDGWI